jgi:erythromycin esterase-like protein
MDMQFSIPASIAALAGKWPEGSREARLYQELRQWWQSYQDDPARYKFAFAAGKEPANLLAAELYGLAANADLATRRLLRMLVDAEEYYRIMTGNQYAAWSIRSRHFADYLLSVLHNEGKGHGVVAWAHNSHVGDMSATEVGDTGLTSFGQLVREALGKDQVFILGSAGFAGTVLAAPEWYGDPVEMAVPPAAPGSLEAILESGGWSNSLILFENDEERRLWAKPLLHRGIGVTYNPAEEMPSYWLTAKISSRYDALVFWRKTRALQQLSPP